METLKLHSDGRKRLCTSLQLLVLKLMEQQVITTSASEHLLLVKHLAEWNTVNTTSMVLWKQMYVQKKFSFIYVFYITHVLSCFVILLFQFSTFNCTEMLQIKVCWGWEACFYLQEKKAGLFPLLMFPTNRKSADKRSQSRKKQIICGCTTLMWSHGAQCITYTAN